ncbi:MULTISPECIES: O-methyltransferase [Microbacterium]|jgi:predicted O-methyltransferase YrrM|uniref:Class I SAM-dependent methyltransferase n=1 Tax=Microbacterium aurugineum TaxID=2851642 RepID=A0ABY4IZN2_9MICO|nr:MULTISPECIES: class I SAM-dependent methyltransferase [Microbacterium]PKQ33772.1 MAG: methyltransferase [Actinobacteria bacterium HGW-Actinobacteria-11]MCE0508352.1 class I SAM-dependent methyltransferase [Microbacterium sp. KKR3/1]MCK8466532.1 class I SAM-dependent methyltransferase [Microbacterium aurugineum]MCK8477022.1 class I SAM-dependent methyltransferase [Microbacterium aurugineum]QEA29038.1 methyltransferase domain-containing protein [Microbacterium sp. CBA3102]
MSEHDANARFLRESIVEPDSIARARAHAVELGAMPVSTVVGSQIAVLAAATGARSIVEIGTGAGVSGLWLLRGAPHAVLTTIDNEPEHLAAARQAFADARVPSTRVRFITGRAIDVLPRMNEASYDIVLVDADPEHIIEYVEHGLRLARTGGLVLVPRVLAGGRVADPVQRDEITSAYRSLVQETQESSAVLATVSPAAEGLLQLISLPERD